MVMATQNNPLKLSDARRLTPKPEGIGAYAEQMRLAAMHAIKEDDVTELMASMLKRAKEGDINAAKFVLGFLTTGTREGGADKSQQVVIVNSSTGSEQAMREVRVNTPAGMMEKYAEDPDLACERCSMYEREEGSKLCMTCRNCEKQQGEFTEAGEPTRLLQPKKRGRPAGS